MSTTPDGERYSKPNKVPNIVLGDWIQTLALYLKFRLGIDIETNTRGMIIAQDAGMISN